MINLLEALCEKHVKIWLATAAPIENVNFIIDGLGIRKYFYSMFYEGKVTKLKPDPEIYIKSCEAIGYAPNRVVVFEDSINGIKAAVSAGCKVVAVASSEPKSSY